MIDTIRASIELPATAVVVQAAPPELVSQKTSETVLGIGRRAFLESLPAFRGSGGEVIVLGRLRLVNRASYVAWLSLKRSSDQFDSNDAVRELAAEFGLRVVGSRAS
jgi:hypothetical protein